MKVDDDNEDDKDKDDGGVGTEVQGRRFGKGEVLRRCDVVIEWNGICQEKVAAEMNYEMVVALLLRSNVGDGGGV